MEKVLMYPNYWDYFYYNKGEDVVLLVRRVREEEVYRRVIYFDSVDEARLYFDNI